MVGVVPEFVKYCSSLIMLLNLIKFVWKWQILFGDCGWGYGGWEALCDFPVGRIGRFAIGTGKGWI